MTRWDQARVEAVCRSGIPHYDPWASAGDFFFDAEAALRAILFFELVLTFSTARWAGKPFLLADWQAAIVGNLFGWKRPDGTRRYRKCLIFTARKSGKTELAAGISLLLLFIDGEPAPEIVTAAGNAEQARRIFKAASAMVSAAAALKRRAGCFKNAIECHANSGVMKVINSEAKTKHGDNLHAALIDELHVHKDADLVEVLETSTLARAQPLIIYTTTAGTDPESIAGEVYDYACRVRDGVIDDREFLPVIYEIPKTASVEDPANWKMAQPNLDLTVPSSKYASTLAEAKASPRKMQMFRQLLCNQWTESAESLFPLEDWKACALPIADCQLPIEELLQRFKGRKATLGIDLSSTTDTTAVVACIEIDGGNLLVAPFIFIPRDNAEGRFRRQKRDKAPYLSWIASRFITATEGNAVDYEVVERKIDELAALLNIVEIQADPYNASGLLERLINKGMVVTTIRQGWSLSQATKEAERMMLKRKLLHPGNPAFTWQVNNCAGKTDDNDNVWPCKKRSTGRIDAAVSMIESINAMLFGKGKEGEAVDPVVFM
jgi:phage terminase large subunit-like protein